MRPFLVSGILACLLPISGQTQVSRDAQRAGGPVAIDKNFFICNSCHTLGKNSIGPNLIGVYGRRSGSYEGYDYSIALRNSHITWDDANLREWLRGPGKKFPGTKDLSEGFSDEKKIDDIIAKLKNLK